ncbi:unnamed protein product, partial [marine sediment metagenome]
EQKSKGRVWDFFPLDFQNSVEYGGNTGAIVCTKGSFWISRDNGVATLYWSAANA